MSKGIITLRNKWDISQTINTAAIKATTKSMFHLPITTGGINLQINGVSGKTISMHAICVRIFCVALICSFLITAIG
jgi:hypothetical protein